MAAFLHLLVVIGSTTNQEVFFLRHGPATIGALLQRVQHPHTITHTPSHYRHPHTTTLSPRHPHYTTTLSPPTHHHTITTYTITTHTPSHYHHPHYHHPHTTTLSPPTLSPPSPPTHHHTITTITTLSPPTHYHHHHTTTTTTLIVSRTLEISQYRLYTVDRSRQSRGTTKIAAVVTNASYSSDQGKILWTETKRVLKILFSRSSTATVEERSGE